MEALRLRETPATENRKAVGPSLGRRHAAAPDEQDCEDKQTKFSREGSSKLLVDISFLLLVDRVIRVQESGLHRGTAAAVERHSVSL